MIANSAALTAAWSRGRLRNHTANQQAHTRPGRAYSRNSQRQPSGPINFAVTQEARTPPMSMKLLRIAEAEPRRVAGYHAARIIVQQGKMPACKAPIAQRAPRRVEKFVAVAVNAITMDQPAAYTVSARRPPQRWASQPLG